MKETWINCGLHAHCLYFSDDHEQNTMSFTEVKHNKTILTIHKHTNSLCCFLSPKLNGKYVLKLFG